MSLVVFLCINLISWLALAVFGFIFVCKWANWYCFDYTHKPVSVKRTVVGVVGIVMLLVSCVLLWAINISLYNTFRQVETSRVELPINSVSSQNSDSSEYIVYTDDDTYSTDKSSDYLTINKVIDSNDADAHLYIVDRCVTADVFGLSFRDSSSQIVELALPTENIIWEKE